MTVRRITCRCRADDYVKTMDLAEFSEQHLIDRATNFDVAQDARCEIKRRLKCEN
jgi:hypothetical protein